MRFVEGCLSVEVTDVNGREISLHTDRIRSIDDLLCVVNGFIVTCQEQDSRRSACSVRPYINTYS